MDLRLTNKRALVTGGSRGIGKAVARQLALEGVDVALVARTPEPLARAAEELSHASGRRVIAAPADTASAASVDDVVAAVTAELGGIDILINAAAAPGGGAPPPSLEHITDDLFFADVNVKVMGYLRCARAVVPGMRRNSWGRIVNISGLAARQTGSTIGSIRNVSVAALTKNLADELGGTGINVTVVHPGLTWTERMPDLITDRAREQGRPYEEVLAQLQGSNALGRLVTAEEVADVVTFLASPRAVAINGDAIAVGGGVGSAIHY